MRVLVVDDNPVMRAGLEAMLRMMDDVDDVVEAADGIEALRILDAPGSPPVDLMFLDVRMPGMDGLTVLERTGDVPVVMLTNADDADTISTALRKGAKGYLVNGEFTKADLVTAVHLCRSGGVMLSRTAAARTALSGRRSQQSFSLTERERELMTALADGLSNQLIARRLNVSEHTVKNHLNHVYAKMGVASRGEAIAAWLRTG